MTTKKQDKELFHGQHTGHITSKIGHLSQVIGVNCNHLLAPTLAETRFSVASMLRLDGAPAPKWHSSIAQKCKEKEKRNTLHSSSLCV